MATKSGPLRLFYLDSDGKVRHNPRVRLPQQGDVIMIRLPFDDSGPLSDISSSAVTGATRLNYHPCVVVDARLNPTETTWKLSLFVVRPYSHHTNPAAYISTLPTNLRKWLVPVPPPPGVAPAHTPTGFGPPLQVFSGGFKNISWIKAKMESFEMEPGKAFKTCDCFLDFNEITRLLEYSRRLEADDTGAGTSSGGMDSGLGGGDVSGGNMGGGSRPTGGGGGLGSGGDLGSGGGLGGSLSGGPAGNDAGKESGGSGNESGTKRGPTVVIQHYGNMAIPAIYWGALEASSDDDYDDDHDEDSGDHDEDLEEREKYISSMLAPYHENASLHDHEQKRRSKPGDHIIRWLRGVSNDGMMV